MGGYLMPDNRDPRLYDLQVSTSMPLAKGLDQGSNLLLPPLLLEERLAHFAEEVFNIAPETHLARFMKALLGESGAGYIRKRLIILRLAEALSGTTFFDIDRFFGALFAVGRRSHEAIEFDPYTEYASVEDWEAVLAADAAYRSRVYNFAKAIHLGATPVGIESISEAMLEMDVDLTEGYIRADQVSRTYGELEGDFADYGSMDGELYDSLEGGDGDASSQDRFHFTVKPKKAVSYEAQYDLVRALMRFKPANTTFSIQPATTDLLRRVAIRTAWSPSRYWEVRRRVVTTRSNYQAYGAEAPGELVEPRSAPFTTHQNEAWSLLGSLIGISSYTLPTIIQPLEAESDPDVVINGSDVATPHLVERINFSDGSYIDYFEKFAIRNEREVMAGRMASDGIAVSNPFMSRTDYGGLNEPTDPNGSSLKLPEIKVDGVPLSQVPSEPSDPTTWARQFWSTPPRQADWPTPEVLELRMREGQFVNYLGFEVPRFPHFGVVQFQTPQSAVWQTLYTYSIRESFPERLMSRVDPGDARHPQHNIAGHWREIKVPFQGPLDISRLRIVMQRSQQGSPPRDSTGNPIAYSLGIKNLDFGARVRSDEDLPRLPQPPDTGWASTTDALGSTVYLDTRTREAEAVLEDSNTPWLSEIYPIGTAVVPLYLDLRDAQGQGQVIDRFWVDPVTEGVPFNLYWSDGVVDYSNTFDGAIRDLPISISGPAVFSTTGIYIEDGASVVVDNTLVQADFDQDWWMGFIFQPFHSSAEGDHGLWKASNPDAWTVHCYCSGGELTFEIEDLTRWGTPQTFSIPCEFQADDIVRTAVSWDATSKVLTLHTHSNSQGYTAETFDLGFEMGGIPSEFLFGDTIDATHWHGEIKSLILKAGATLAPNSDAVTQWIDLDVDYPIPAVWKKDDDGHSDNIIMAYHPIYWSASSATRTGFTGLAASYLDKLSWTRLPRTYKLSRGFVHLPPTLAKFIKFEFSGLAPRWYENFIPIQRDVPTFPSHIIRRPTQTDGRSSRVPGLETMLNRAQEFVDRPEDISLQDPDRPTPTEGVFASDPMLQRTLSGRAWFYNTQSHHIPESIPGWPEDGQHIYRRVKVRHDTRIGYWVGIKSIEAWRVDATGEDDTYVYRDLLHDLHNIDESSLTFSSNPGYIWSSIHQAQMTSKVMNSLHGVRAVQFATQQTPAVQLLPNDDFRDPATQRDSEPRHVTYTLDSDHIVTAWDVSLEEAEAAAHRADPDDTWSSTDNLDGSITITWPLVSSDDLPWGYYYDIRRPITAWHTYGDATLGHSLLGATVTITRDRSNDTAFRAVLEGIMRPPGEPVGSFRDGGIGPKNINYGGIESPVVAVSKRGMISAAVRLRADSTLSSPLLLQIIAADDTTVLAQVEINPSPGEVVEETVNYHITDNYADGSLPLLDPRTILDYPIKPILSGEDELTDLGETFHAMRVRLIQEGSSQDTWTVDRLSLFDESITWEFSVDGGSTWQEPIGEIRNNPNGLIQFPTEGNALVWRATAWRKYMAISAIQVRPWYEGNTNVRQILPQRGGLISTFDQDPSINDDPEFQRWRHITPHWWYLSGQRFPDDPMALDDAPVVTQYARHFSRVLDVDVSGITDDAVRATAIARDMEIDLSSQDDEASRSGDFARSVEVEAPASDTIEGWESLGGEWSWT